MTWVMVDVEADGPCPGLYSMVSFGAIVVEPGLSRTFYSEVIQPLTDRSHDIVSYVPESLAVSGVTREEQLKGRDPYEAMEDFRDWLSKIHRPMLVSDNNGYDAPFFTYYFHRFLNENPFGHSSQNLGSLYKGQVKSMFKNFKHLRDTKHTHHPVDDARGNAEALLKMKEMGLKISW